MLAVIILLWGLNFVVSRFLSGIYPVRASGVLFALFRYSLGALTMVVVMIYQRKGVREIAEEVGPYRRMLLLSAFFSALFVIGTHTSTEFLPSGTTSIIVNLSPIIVLLFGVVFMSEKATPTKVLGFMLGFAGGVMYLWTRILFLPGAEIGIVLALLGLFAWAGYTISLHYLEGANRYIVMTVNHITSSLMILPFILLMVLEGATLTLVWDAYTVAGFLFSGVLGSGLAYVLYFSAIEMLGAARASSFLFLIPFVSLVGDFALGEPPELLALLAGAVAILGVALVRLSDAPKTEGHNDSD
jgi:drug/metabolite transporter (DMT)-like permease